MKIRTRIIKVDPENPEDDKIGIAAEEIKKGNLVAFPTETVYGLGADALNEKAVRKIFEVKGRPADNPLIVHVSSVDQIYEIAQPNEIAKKLIDAFFPGPLTLVMKNKKVPKITTAGLDTVAVRMPDHKVALKLIELSETPIAAPSANKSGKPSPTKAEHVLEDLGNLVDVIIDGGETKIGLESTVVDTTVYPVEILRPGAITKEELEEYVDVKYAEDFSVAKSPGMKYKHYAPDAETIVLVGKNFLKKATQIAEDFVKKGYRVGVAGLNLEEKRNDVIYKNFGRNLEEMAKNLFKVLRELDKECDVIIVQGVEEKGIGKAIMNRLYKAGRVFRI
ncbi:Sua5/YciO/YrdC/YwlC family protein [Ferroglobus placidus DSM 10642]|uniref:Threonylcarbamoyl-AMP synthase n=1 Tax=Ferroglobus placidus (strain DSM 10642 / AEDII12DO) TaxID=589924 RepID=D3RX12_FERPA|nr:L-threonylcarbamoyladenylate synthase [Ferroglobus placidus]ADC65025.1 Sua5/YciO/YrdC/YwlC family protein [Ferroglobus placidus DSM 10642]